MPRNEADTRAELIDPVLNDLGWKGSLFIKREHHITNKKPVIVGEKVTFKKGKSADYLLKYNDIPLAVIEAKEEGLHSGAGMQQAKDYAEILQLRFAYSTNGIGIEEFDFFTNEQRSIDIYPTPQELWERSQQRNKLSTETQRLLSIPYKTDEKRTPRYYQHHAISKTMESVAKGEKRVLLNLATGTGKTTIAFQITWKLKQAEKVKRVLFLADRNVLCEQAFNSFEPFQNARAYITEGNIPTAHEIYFSIYQAMYAEKDGKRIFQHYPKDFFDLIIIDECHRSGFGSWNDILQHFNSSIQIGMTATPKETENINTYKYFCKKENGYKALYTYSMNQGIEDGFLAGFLLDRFKMTYHEKNLKLEEVVKEGATIEVPEVAEPKPEYSAKEFEEKLKLPDRTELMCSKLAEIIRKTGEMHKTIVFCVTQEHADDVTKLMNNHFKDLGYSNYAVTITADKTDSESLSRVFQDEISERPVIATTVDMLSTGYDAPSVRNIVFMKYVSSPIVFKQIFGRGSRISEQTDKYFFRVVDFTNATRLLDEWEKGGGGGEEQSETGNSMICGIVAEKETGNPIQYARVVLQVTANKQKIEMTNEKGEFVFHGLPEREIGLYATARNFRPKQVTIQAKVDCAEPLRIELMPQGNPPKPIIARGVKVEFEEEAHFQVEVTGQRFTLVEYLDYTKQKVKEKFSNAEKLREDWADREKRQEVVEELQKEGINTEILAAATKQTEADDLDLLSNIAFDKEIHTREERAVAFKNLQQDFINTFSDDQKKIIQQLLFYYQLNGADEFVNPKIFELIFPNSKQAVVTASEKFGNTDNLISALSELQKRIYTR